MSQLPADFLMDDLDAMFCAVAARLRSIADGSEEANAAPAIGASHRMSTGVLDCVAALDQLREMLAREIERRRRLEQIVHDAKVALERAPPELVAELGLTLHVPAIGRLLTRVPEPARPG